MIYQETAQFYFAHIEITKIYAVTIQPSKKSIHSSDSLIQELCQHEGNCAIKGKLSTTDQILNSEDTLVDKTLEYTEKRAK